MRNYYAHGCAAAYTMLTKNAGSASQENIFRRVRQQYPDLPLRHASGGLPDARGLSDVDVSLLTATPQQLLSRFPEGTTPTHDERRSIYSLPGYDRPVNVYATSDPDLARRGVRHRNVERALAKHFPELAAEAHTLKQEGLGTEKAWAHLLELPGDPYETMLKKQQVLRRATHKDYLTQLQQILAQAKLDPSQVTVGASGVLGALGLKRTHDLDVHVSDPKAFKALTKLPDSIVDTAPSGSPRIRINTARGEIEFFTGPWMTDGEDFSATKTPPTVYHQTPHWSPEHTLAWKRRMGRPKDRADIAQLERYLKTRRT